MKFIVTYKDSYFGPVEVRRFEDPTAAESFYMQQKRTARDCPVTFSVVLDEKNFKELLCGP